MTLMDLTFLDVDTQRRLNAACKVVAPFLMELIGTFFLCLTVSLVLGNPKELLPLAPIAIGVILMVMVYIGGHVSGGHFNPAVSFAVWLSGRNKLNAPWLIGYWIAQLGGAFIAALVAKYTAMHDAGYPRISGNVWEAFVLEALFTYVLCAAVLNSATTTATAGNSYYGLIIGFTVLAGAIAAGGLSGAAFNPAVGTGIPLVVGATEHHRDIWVYWAGPMLGALVASVLYRIMNSDEYLAGAGVSTETKIEGTEEPLVARVG